jgi:hypothetical protein
MRIPGALLAVVASAWSGAGSCAPSEPTTRPLAPADQIAAHAVAMAAAARHAPAAGRQAARALVVEGDAAYRDGRYDEAHRFFEEATPNMPSAYAFLMTADAHWRASVAYGRTLDATSPRACRLQRDHFVDDLRLDLNQGYLLGLRLARIEPGRPLAGSPLLARATESARCLTRLADELAPLPPESCVDEARIAACLGDPLRR